MILLSVIKIIVKTKIWLKVLIQIRNYILVILCVKKNIILKNYKKYKMYY